MHAQRVRTPVGGGGAKRVPRLLEVDKPRADAELWGGGSEGSDAEQTSGESLLVGAGRLKRQALHQGPRRPEQQVHWQR